MKSNFIVTLDLGTSCVRGVVAQRLEDGTVSVAATESVESRGIRYGAVINPADAAFCIRELLTKLENKEPLHSLGLTVEQVYAGLGGRTVKTLEHTVLRTVAADEEVSQELIDEMHNECLTLPALSEYRLLEVAAQEYLADDEPERNPVGLTGIRHLQGRYRLVVAAPEFGRNLKRAFEKASVKIAGMYLAPVVVPEALLTAGEKELGCACIDFGGGTTSLTVYQDGLLRYVAVVPLGGELLTRDLRDLNLVAEAAEELKVKHGNALVELTPDVQITIPPISAGGKPLDVSTRLVASFLEARLVEILKYLRAHLERSGYALRLGAGAVISGGASRLKNLDRLVSRELSVEVRRPEAVADPSLTLLTGLLAFADQACTGAKTPSAADRKRKGKGLVEKFLGSLTKKATEKTDPLVLDIFKDNGDAKIT